MRITVGSKNEVKIQGVKDALMLYHRFADADVVGIDVSVDVVGHPKNIEEIVAGAVDRAQQAFIDCEYSFGIESGLMEVPQSKSGHMEMQVCAIFDGTSVHLGLAPGFEWPRKVTEMILSGTADGSKAFKDAGYTDMEHKLGAIKGGIIGVLTNSLKTREEQIKDSIIMAMIQLEHPYMY